MAIINYRLFIVFVFITITLFACSYPSSATMQTAVSPSEDDCLFEADDIVMDVSTADVLNNSQPENDNTMHDTSTPVILSDEAAYVLPEYVEEDDGSVVKAALEKLPSGSSYRPILRMENWFLFDKSPDAPHRTDYGTGKSRCLVHVNTGKIAKNDLHSIGQFFKDIHLFENEHLINSSEYIRRMINMISCVLDENSSPISGRKSLPWDNDIRLEFLDGNAVIDYWNNDTAGMRANSAYTHHVITISKDYKVSETRERRRADGSKI